MNVNGDQTRDQSWRWRTCVHEAGHAVAALLLGYESVGVAVFDGGARGLATPHAVETAEMPPETYHAPPTLDERHRGMSWPELLRAATYAAAGAAGEALLLQPERLRCEPRDGDAEVCYSIARAAVPSNCNGVVERDFAALAANRARSMLDPFESRVRRVAEELNRLGRLTADEVVAAGWPEHSTRKESQT